MAELQKTYKINVKKQKSHRKKIEGVTKTKSCWECCKKLWLNLGLGSRYDLRFPTYPFFQFVFGRIW